MYECHKWANTRLNHAFTGHGIRERETILDLGVTCYIIIAWHKSALAPSIPLSIRFHLALRPWASIASRNGSYQECSVVAMLSSLVIIVRGHRNWNMKITRRWCSLGSDCQSLNIMLLKIAWFCLLVLLLEPKMNKHCKSCVKGNNTQGICLKSFILLSKKQRMNMSCELWSLSYTKIHQNNLRKYLMVLTS